LTPFNYLHRILGINDKAATGNEKRLAEGMILLPDNPANYALYEKLEAHIRELDAMIRNNGDLISYYQTADGYISPIIDLLQGMRELALQKGNSIYSLEDREYIDREFGMYFDQIIFILENAEFNRIKIFKDLFDHEIIKERIKTGKVEQVDEIDVLLAFFTRQRILYGTKSRVLELTNQGLGITEENMNHVQSSFVDIDMAEEFSELRKNHLLVLINLLLLAE
jgi:flagellin